MKIPLGKQIPQNFVGQNPFIDRKTQKDRFWQEYNMHKGASESWSVSVLNYHGMGGIGKSELANSLHNELKEKSIDHIFFTFSEDGAFLDNMIEFRNSLFNTAGISFVYFDTAYVAYCAKSGRSISELAEKSILNSKYMSALRPILSTLPNKPINIISKCLQVLAPFEKDLKRSFRGEYFDFDQLTPDRLYDRLLYYFLLDLQDSFQNRQNPFPIILDNIDANSLSETMEFKRWFLSDKGMFQNIPNIIWCLFSREKISEKDFPEKVLQCIPVEEFSYDDTKEYLEAFGIDQQCWLHIYSLTEGIPLYLYICVEDYYVQLRKKQEIQLSEIGANKKELIHSFLKHLNPDQKKVLQLMAFLEIWSEDFFLAFLDEMKLDETTYYEIRDRNFVKRHADKCYLHNVVVKAIREYTIPSYYKRLKNAYNKIAGSLGLDEDDLLKTKITIYELNDDEELERYIFSLVTLFEKYVETLDIDYVYSLHKIICDRMMNYPNKILALSLSYYYYGLILWKIGNPSKALVQMQIAYQYTCDVIKPVVFNDVSYKYYIINVKGDYAHLLYLNGQYDEALKLRQSCLSEIQKLDGKKSFTATACMQNLARQYLDKPEYRETGIQMLNKIIKRRENFNLSGVSEQKMNERYKMYAKLDLATVYAEMEEYEKAIELGSSAITEMNKTFGESDYDTKLHLENFSNILMQVRAFDVIIDILKKVFLEWKEIMNDDSIVLQSLKYKLGIAYGECGRTEEGKQLMRELYEFSYDTLGIYHKKTLRNRKQYAIILAQEGNHSEAIDMLSDCLKIYLDCYGMDGDDQLLHLYSSLVSEYRIVHNDEMVKQLQNEVLKTNNWETTSSAEMEFLKSCREE